MLVCSANSLGARRRGEGGGGLGRTKMNYWE